MEECHTQPRTVGSAGCRASVALLIIVLAGVAACGSGCRKATPTGESVPRATARYGPLEPVEVSAGAEVFLASSYGPSPAADVAPGQWPLEISVAKGEVKTIVIWRELIVVDGIARGDSARAWYLGQTVGIFSSVPLSRVLTAVKTVRLVQRDNPELGGLTLSASQVEAFGAALDLGFKEPEGVYGNAPYPDYQLELISGSGNARLDWTRREYITLWTPGVLDKVSVFDPEERAWQLCLGLSPPPPSDKLEGLGRLFGVSSLQITRGGSDRPADCAGWLVPALVRLLRQGTPASEPLPGGEPSLVASLVGTEREWKVNLYQNSFTFEGESYLLENAAERFMAVVNID